MIKRLNKDGNEITTMTVNIGTTNTDLRYANAYAGLEISTDQSERYGTISVEEYHARRRDLETNTPNND